MPPIANLRHSKLFWAAVLLLAVTAAWPLLSHSGLLNTRGGGDSPFLLQRLHQLTTALLDGHFPVRWMPDANYGYGYPFFNYYAPLSIYIAAAFRFLGFSYVGAIKAAQLTGFLVAGIGMFYLGRLWFKNSWAGLLAAAAYTFAPFHMVNIYVRGDSLAEFWAMAFYPLVLLTAGRLVDQPKRPLNIALFALTYAALILSHNISVLIFSPFLFLYLALALLKKFKKGTTETTTGHQSAPTPNPQSILFILLALLLALALSAWFWLPALAEQGLAQLEPVTAGYFHYSNHFRGADLVQTSLLFNYDVAGGGAFRMGLLQLGLILSGLGLIWFTVIKRRKPAILPAVLITLSFLIATLMITPLSRPLWDNLPLLPFTQFPWRFLSVQALFGALSIGGLALLPRSKQIVPLFILIIALSGLGALKTDHLYLTDEDVTAERLAQYEWFTGNIGSTVSAEYLPPEVQPRPFTSPWLNTGYPTAVLGLNSPIESEPLQQETAHKSWQINAPSPTNIVLPVLNWPGWQATVDGTVAPTQPAPGSGLIMLDLPPGEHTVSLQLARTPIRLTAELISLTAILIVVGLCWFAARKMNGRKHLKTAAVALACLLLVIIVLRLWPTPETEITDLTWDFEQLGYLHHSPDGIPFENDLLLWQYGYDHTMIEPGQEMLITLTWQNGPGIEATIDLVSPAIQRFETAPVIASQTSQSNESSQSFYRLTIPENTPNGRYIPRLTMNGVKALTGSGQTRGDLYFRPFWVVGSSRQAEGDTAPLDVRAVDGIPQANDSLLVKLQWLTSQPLTENYNLSLRLLDSNGLMLAQQDAQPGLGFLPSSSWQPGRWQNDWLTLPLPDGFTAEQSPSAPYAIVARLYDVKTEQVVLTRQVGQMVWQENGLAFQETRPNFELPADITPTTATFEDLIQFQGYDLQQTAESLSLTLYWQALAKGQEDLFHFVHLVDPDTGNIVAQHDSMPRNNTYPTSQWLRTEIVSDNLRLDLTDVPAGTYLLYIGLYRNLGDTFPALAGIDQTGQPLPDNRLLLDSIVVQPR